MRTIWLKARPHLLSWHMLPCLMMVLVAVGVVVATGRPGALLGAFGCMMMMMMMMVMMMAGMVGHSHAGASKKDPDRKL